MAQTSGEEIKFEGEEAGAGLAAPVLDLIAAGFLIVLSIVVLIASFMLPVPGEMRTAPGLLPILTAASLAVMAILLGVSALKRHRAGIPLEADAFGDRGERHRVFILASTVAIYIAALQFLAFQAFFSVANIPFVLSAFEPVTILALATIIHVSWRGPIWITATISVVWTLTLSVVFQKLFLIPLPGGF